MKYLKPYNESVDNKITVDDVKYIIFPEFLEEYNYNVDNVFTGYVKKSFPERDSVTINYRWSPYLRDGQIQSYSDREFNKFVAVFEFEKKGSDITSEELKEDFDSYKHRLGALGYKDINCELYVINTYYTKGDWRVEKFIIVFSKTNI